MVRPWITQHAVDRYLSRVDSSVSPYEARECIRRILAFGRVRSTPRHWMRARVQLTPGLRFVYWHEQPDVCALVLDGAVVTILTRALCRPLRFVGVPGGQAEPIYAADTARWTAGLTWDEADDEEAA
jgi:hypothetical protein